uniref:Uncharacterized protein n=1 Tax=Rhizophora mucronata TaxID=61149 RepID=A0A2P2L4N3_RHIMU
MEKHAAGARRTLKHKNFYPLACDAITAGLETPAEILFKKKGREEKEGTFYILLLSSSAGAQMKDSLKDRKEELRWRGGSVRSGL